MSVLIVLFFFGGLIGVGGSPPPKCSAMNGYFSAIFLLPKEKASQDNVNWTTAIAQKHSSKITLSSRAKTMLLNSRPNSPLLPSRGFARSKCSPAPTTALGGRGVLFVLVGLRRG